MFHVELLERENDAACIVEDEFLRRARRYVIPLDVDAVYLFLLGKFPRGKYRMNHHRRIYSHRNYVALNSSASTVPRGKLRCETCVRRIPFRLSSVLKTTARLRRNLANDDADSYIARGNFQTRTMHFKGLLYFYGIYDLQHLLLVSILLFFFAISFA